MVYTEDVKKKLDDILEAFADFIDSQNYFDITYSKKVGYVLIVVEDPESAGAKPLDTPEVMLDNLFDNFMYGIIHSPENITRTSERPALTEYAEAEGRRQITAIMERIQDNRSEYLDYLDSYLMDYHERHREDDSL